MTTKRSADTIINSELARQLGFDADDLRANQAGQLSARQRRGLRRELIVWIPVYALAAALVLLIVLPLLTSDRFYIFFVLIAFVITVRFVVDWLKTASELRQGAPVVIEGVAHHVTQTFRYRSSIYRLYRPRQSKWHYLVIDGVQFPMSYEGLTTFKEGRWYRLYCLPLSKTILSADRG
jgi:hypothetical protein